MGGAASEKWARGPSGAELTLSAATGGGSLLLCVGGGRLFDKDDDDDDDAELETRLASTELPSGLEV